jgi:hypothetical protein
MAMNDGTIATVARIDFVNQGSAIRFSFVDPLMPAAARWPPIIGSCRQVTVRVARQ